VLLADIFRHKPLFGPDNWLAMETQLEALVAGAAATEKAEAVEDKALGFKDDAEGHPLRLSPLVHHCSLFHAECPATGRRMAQSAREMREALAEGEEQEAFDGFM
jgi:hypothetical protein